MTLSPCRILQNVIHTQKCVPCREYAEPNRCVFKCFAKVSKPKKEDLKPTSKAFHRKRSQTPVSPMTRNNNVTTSSRSQSRSTRHRRSTSALVSKISRDRTTQALNPYAAKEGGLLQPPCSFSPVSFSRIFFSQNVSI